MVAVLQPVTSGKLIPIDRAVVLVGRSSDCDAVIEGSKKISRRHCCLVQVDDSYYVRDLGSMNGIWLNGERVTREAQLTAGDRLAIGDVEFLFHSNVRIERSKPTVTEEGGAAAATDIDAAHDDSPSDEKEFELIDDVIPLDQLDSDYDLLVETNEVEVIDAPIVDEPFIDMEEDDDSDEEFDDLNSL